MHRSESAMVPTEHGASASEPGNEPSHGKTTGSFAGIGYEPGG